MAQVRFTKNELRDQQIRLSQLEKYLPTLQLKKALLQMEVNTTQQAIEKLKKEKKSSLELIEPSEALIAATFDCRVTDYVQIEHVQKQFENIAGVEVPIFEGVQFANKDYGLFTTPAWADALILQLQNLVILREKIHVMEEKKRALEHELREVSIRVNLFEKILIPRSHAIIKKIKLFLGEQQLVAVAQAKVAKAKILARKER